MLPAPYLHSRKVLFIWRLCQMIWLVHHRFRLWVEYIEALSVSWGGFVLSLVGYVSSLQLHRAVQAKLAFFVDFMYRSRKTKCLKRTAVQKDILPDVQTIHIVMYIVVFAVWITLFRVGLCVSRTRQGANPALQNWRVFKFRKHRVDLISHIFTH